MSSGGTAWRLQCGEASGGVEEAGGWAAVGVGAKAGGGVPVGSARSRARSGIGCVVQANRKTIGSTPCISEGQKGFFTLQMHEKKGEKLENTPNGSRIKWLLFEVIFLQKQCLEW